MTEFIYLDQDDNELQRAWGIIGNYDSDLGVVDPMSAENDGERWQYMGTSPKDGIWHHCFRHRYHPVIGDRVYLWVEAMDRNKLTMGNPDNWME